MPTLEPMIRKPGDRGPTHAGGVVYRVGQDRLEYLLVRPKRGEDEWVLPKGHIEPGEESEQTAFREVQEETGVLARVIAPLETIEFTARGRAVRVKFFLMKFLSQAAAREVREVRWSNYEDALCRLSHAPNRDLLRSAEQARRKAAA